MLISSHFKFCPFCGNLLQPRLKDHKERLYCSLCRRTHYRNPTVGVAVIILKEDRILLVRRRGSYEGMWCIPCGHLEWDEDVKESACRECKEETGLDVSVGSVFAVHSNFHDPQHQTVGIWFWGTPIGGILRPGSDACEAAYFSLDNLPEQMAFPTDILVCNDLKKYLESIQHERRSSEL
jgi:ADP-ribose pyrophosphatase YjhB (NUDIX family)